jgi:hypothetical protein
MSSMNLVFTTVGVLMCFFLHLHAIWFLQSKQKAVFYAGLISIMVKQNEVLQFVHENGNNLFILI